MIRVLLSAPLCLQLWHPLIARVDRKCGIAPYLYFFIAGKPDAYRLAFMTSSLEECADPRNINERHRVEQYMRRKVRALLRP